MKGEALLALLQKEFAIQTDTKPWQEEINRLCLYTKRKQNGAQAPSTPYRPERASPLPCSLRSFCAPKNPLL